MTPDVVLKLGWAFGKCLQAGSSDPLVLIGKDTRASGYVFESVLEAGLTSAGVNVGLLGPLPTPGIARLVQDLNASGGIAISASHNPHYDNGIKFLSASGEKLSRRMEGDIEEWFEKPLQMADAERLGKARRITDASRRYIQFCVDSFAADGAPPLQGMRLAVDCANGAAYHVAPEIYRALGAKVLATGIEPDGFNINRGVGTMDMSGLRKKTVGECCDCGVALDGDGDRLLMVDSDGRLIDGDELLFLIADYRHRKKFLNGGVVGTQMSNSGLESALRLRGIPFERTKVGDRYVLEMMKRKNWRLGGESSGHLLCLDKSNSCDAIVSSLVVLQIVCESGKSFAQLLEAMEKHHQQLVNIPLKRDFEKGNSEFAEVVSSAQRVLGEEGRVLVRPSGTEPLLRVMVEARSEELCRTWAGKIAAVANRLFSA